MKRLLFLSLCSILVLYSQSVSNSGGSGGGGGGGGASAASTTYTAGTYYFAPAGGVIANATETNVQAVVGVAGSISNFTAKLSAAPGAGVTVTFTWRDNISPAFSGPASQAVTCSIGPAQTSCTDTTHNFTTGVNDLIDIQMVVSGGTTAAATVVMTWGLPGIPGATGATGATGSAGPAPSGTGVVIVSSGVLGTPVPFSTTPGANTIPEAGAGGTIAAGWLPSPAATTLGGVESKDCSGGGQFVQKINTDGTETCATPAGGGNVSGPVSSTNLFLPQWSGTSGTSLVAGLPVSNTPASNTVVESGSGGTLAAGWLPTSVPTSVTNDTNVTGSIASNVLTLGWTGTLAKARLLSTVVFTDQVNTFTSAGSADLSASTVSNAFRLPVFTGATVNSNGALAYDTTAGMYHAAQGNADAKFPTFTVTPAANGNCVTWVVSGSQFKLGDAGAGCGTGSGAVSSVFGRTGAVVAASADYTAAQVTNAVDKTAANTYSGGGLQNLSAVHLQIPAGAGYTATSTHNFGLDTTANNLHGWANAVDSIILSLTGSPANNDCAKFVVSGSNVQLTTNGAACGAGGGSSLWSNIGNPAGPFSPSMSTNTTEFDYATALANAFGWANTTAATSSVNQSSPVLNICGRGWEGSTPADTKDCWQVQNSIANGANPSPTLVISNNGSSTGSAAIQVPGIIVVGTGAGVWGLQGGTQSLASQGANAVGWIGPTSVTGQHFTQAPATAAAANQVMLFGAESGGITAATWANFASTSLTDTGNLVYNNGANTFTAAGTVNLSPSTATNGFRAPVGAGLTVSASGAIGEDSTASNYHFFPDGADGIIAGFLSSNLPSNNNCIRALVSGSNILLGPVAGACVFGTAYQTVDSNGTAIAQRSTVNFISGSNATVSCVDNSGANRSDCTVSASSSAGSRLDQITAATGANSINSGDNAQVWDWDLTTASKSAMTFGENVASTATGTPVLINIQTLAGSTANPFQVTAGGTANGIAVNTSGVLSKIGSGHVNADQINGSAADANGIIKPLNCSGSGTGQAQLATCTPATTSLVDGEEVCWVPNAANTAANPTLQIDGLSIGRNIVKGGGALVANDLVVTTWACAKYNLSGTTWTLLDPQTAPSGGTPSLPLTVAGTVTSGGIPYFNSTTQESSSAAGAAGTAILWGGAGSAPTATTGTLALAGNFATTGAFNTTFAQGGSTTVTLPTTSATMARTDAGQTFTGAQNFATSLAIGGCTIGTNDLCGATTLAFGPTASISGSGSAFQAGSTNFVYAKNPTIGAGEIEFYAGLEDSTLSPGKVLYALAGISEYTGTGAASTKEHIGVAAECNLTGTGTIAACYGLDSEAIIASGGGGTGQAVGGYFRVQNLAASTSISGAGVYIETPINSGGGAITNGYGLQIKDQIVSGIGTAESIHVGNGNLNFKSATVMQEPPLATINNTLTAGTITANKLACFTASNTIGNCTGLPSNNPVGVFSGTTGDFVPTGHFTTVALDATVNVIFGDILCGSSTSAATAHDNGTTPCTNGNWVGIVQTTASSVSSATVYLRLQ